MFVKCPCQHCNEFIEFEADELAEENSVIPCPHCGIETKLFIKPTETKFNCEHCGKPFKIDDRELLELVDENITVPCSHCGIETKLIPSKSPGDSDDAGKIPVSVLELIRNGKKIAATRRKLKDLQADRETADAVTNPINLQVVDGVKGDPNYGEDSDFYAAMGYVRKSARGSGLTRKKAAPAPAGK